MVASVGAKYILNYSERLGKQESHLSVKSYKHCAFKQKLMSATIRISFLDCWKILSTSRFSRFFIPYLVQRNTSSNSGKMLFVRLHLSADKCDSIIYFAPTDATMFQSIHQFQGERMPILLALSYIIWNKKKCRYAHFIQLTQSTKRIAIINVVGKCVCKGCPYRCYTLKFNTLANLFEWQQNW